MNRDVLDIGRWRVPLRRLCWYCIALACVLPGTAAMPSDDYAPRYFRIGTGGSAGTYFPIGSLIAKAISMDQRFHFDPAVAPELLAIAQRSNGSVANVKDLGRRILEGGLAQADVAHWAYTATGPFTGSEPQTSLRAVATLYPESVHLVARKSLAVRSVPDLAGLRVSLDEPGSGTLIDVRLILNAFGLREADLSAIHLKPEDAVERILEDKLDALFIIAGYPAPSVTELLRADSVELVPISGRAVSSLLKTYQFFATDTIPAGTYQDRQEIETLAVGAQLLVRADLEDDFVYGITSILWSEATRQLLLAGHPKGQSIGLDSALTGLGIPLHPGALRYYREAGLKPETSIPVVVE